MSLIDELRDLLEGADAKKAVQHAMEVRCTEAGHQYETYPGEEPNTEFHDCKWCGHLEMKRVLTGGAADQETP